MPNRPPDDNFANFWQGAVTEANQGGFQQVLTCSQLYASGDLNVARSTAFLADLIRHIATLDKAVAMPGFAAYADSLYDPATYIPSSKFTAGRDHLVAIRDALVAVMPFDGDGNLLGYKLNTTTAEFTYDALPVNQALTDAFNAALLWANS